jgi:hypothetical protein
MPPIIRNILSVFLGALVCFILNGVLLGLMMKAIPPPPGFDPNVPATYALLGPTNLLAPLVAHALPSLIGGAIAAMLAASRPRDLALAVGGLHLLGGIAAAVMIPAPAWFVVTDLVLAYLPMAWLGWLLAGARR